MHHISFDHHGEDDKNELKKRLTPEQYQVTQEQEKESSSTGLYRTLRDDVKH